MTAHPAKTQIGLGIRPVWSESSLSAWRKFGSLASHWAHSEDSDQSGWCPGWSESSLGTQSFCWFCHRRLIFSLCFEIKLNGYDHDKFLIWFLFYGPSTHFRSFWAWLVNLATLFLGKPPRQFISSAHSSASNWQLLFLNQRKRENGRRNFFMTKSPLKNVPDVGIELGAACMPRGHVSNRATMPGLTDKFTLWRKELQLSPWSWRKAATVFGIIVDGTSIEPSHEIMVLFVLRKLIFQTCIRPFLCFHISCVRTAKALARLGGCAGSPEPSLVAY